MGSAAIDKIGRPLIYRRNADRIGHQGNVGKGFGIAHGQCRFSSSWIHIRNNKYQVRAQPDELIGDIAVYAIAKR